MATANGSGFASASAQLFLCHSGGIGESRKILLLDGSAYIPTHPSGSPNPAISHTPGRPTDTSVLDETMLNSHAGGSSKLVAFMRRVHIAPTNVIEATDSNDLEDFIAEMTRRFDEEADALDFPARPTSSPSFGPANDKQMESGGATSDSDESDTDDDVQSAASDSIEARAKIYAPFLSLARNDTPPMILPRPPTVDEKENCNYRQRLAVSSADHRPKTSELSNHCDGPRSPPKYPDWAAEIADERERLAAEVLAEALEQSAPRPPMKFDSEVRISRQLRDGSVLRPPSKRRKVVHVSTHEA
ncbi:hypothetical protein EV715DRAFT_273692 [Schizophyllum commune]